MAPLTNDVLDATVRMCASSLVRGAARIDTSVLRLPDRPAEPAVYNSLRLYLHDAPVCDVSTRLYR